MFQVLPLAARGPVQLMFDAYRAADLTLQIAYIFEVREMDSYEADAMQVHQAHTVVAGSKPTTSNPLVVKARPSA